MARKYYEQGDYPRTLAEFLKAYRILLPKLGEAHPTSRKIKTNMESTYQKTAAARQKPFTQWLEEALKTP
jgi:hypothetical protein